METLFLMILSGVLASTWVVHSMFAIASVMVGLQKNEYRDIELCNLLTILFLIVYGAEFTLSVFTGLNIVFSLILVFGFTITNVFTIIGVWLPKIK